MILLLFDIDGTLVQEHPRMLDPYVDALGPEIKVGIEERFVPLSGQTDHVILRRVLRNSSQIEEPHQWQRVLDRYHEHLTSNLQRYPRAFVPGATEFVRTLAKRNVGLGLATGNTRAAARAKLGESLFSLFAAGGFAEHGPERASILATAIESSVSVYGRRFDPTVYFADTPSDIEAAKAVGALSVAVAAGSYSKDALRTAQPSLMIDSFEELSTVDGFLDRLPHLAE